MEVAMEVRDLGFRVRVLGGSLRRESEGLGDFEGVEDADRVGRRDLEEEAMSNFAMDSLWYCF